MPKILIVCPSWGTFGGIQAFAIVLATSVRNEGGQIRLIFRRIRGTGLESSLSVALSDAGFEYTGVDRGSRELFQHVRWADVVHCNTAIVDVALIARLTGTPLLTTIHNHRPRDVSRVRLLGLRVAMGLADQLWYNSDFVARSWRFDVNDPRFAKLPIVSELPTRSIDPSERRGFVFVGRWIENKGIEQLVEAYARSGLSPQEHPLTLVGDGPLRPAVTAALKTFGLDQAVSCPGFVPNAERDRLVASSRWLVAPPATGEDLGLTPIEARSVGVPCIVTDDGGLREAAGRHSLICRPLDVNGLAHALQTAADEDSEAYRARSEATRAELFANLRPLSTYLDRYRDAAAAKLPSDT